MFFVLGILLRGWSQDFRVFLPVVDDAACLHHLLVVVEVVFYRSRLEIVCRHNVGGYYLVYQLLVTVEVGGEVVAEFLLQRIELLLGIVVIAFKLRYLLQLVEFLAAFGVVFESALYHLLLEILILLVGEFELSCRCYSGMLGDVVNLVVEHHFGGVESRNAEIVCYIRQRVGFHFHVGLYSSAVAHLSTCLGVEHVGEAVGNMFGVSAVGMLVVDCLYATVAGDIVFSCRQFELAVIRQVNGCLNETLAVCPRAEHHGAVEVLERT